MKIENHRLPAPLDTLILTAAKVRKHRFLSSSGLVGVRSENVAGKDVQVFPATTIEQIQLCFEHLSDLLKSANATFENVTHIRCALTAADDVPVWNAALAMVFKDPKTRPATSCVIVAKLPHDKCKVQVEATAVAKK